MIARHEAVNDGADLWARLAAPLPAGAVCWRQDGRAVERDGKWFARFVAYVDANTVRERLDAVVPGEYDLTLDLLPPLPPTDEESAQAASLASFKARLQILGVIREDVGTGRDYKAAATDAFKRAAVRFGIGHELYAMEPNWIQVDGEGRFAKPVEDPQTAYERRQARRGEAEVRRPVAQEPEVRRAPTPAPAPATRAPREEREPQQDQPARTVAPVMDTVDPDTVACPKCGGRMWDNRLTKRNPKAPDFKCRDRSCDGVVWPPRGAASSGEGDTPAPVTPRRAGQNQQGRPAISPDAANGGYGEPPASLDASPLGADDDDDLPF